MQLDEIENSLKLVENEYNNLQDNSWIAHRLTYLRGRFDLLKELKEREEANAATRTEQSRAGVNSNNDKGE